MNLIARPDERPSTHIDEAIVANTQPEAGAFTVGSTMRHVLNMTAAGSIGLVAVFFVDFITLLYISRLGDTNLTAAVGYASQLVFLLLSVNIGLSIAVGALVSQALGARDRERARRLAASGITLSTLVCGALSLAAMPFTDQIIAVLGARGDAATAGSLYLRLILPAAIFLGVGMAYSSVLRAVGDAKRAMYVTLAGAVATAILDPILIFGLHLGIYGAAIATDISRLALLFVGLHGAVRVHRLVGRPQLRAILGDIGPLSFIAGPAILTNIATPIANIYVMHVFSRFGDDTVAALAIMDRVTPVAFGVLFALSGSVGPIMGQNFGALAFSRVQAVLTNCYMVAAIYVVGISVVLWAGAPAIVWAFDAKGTTAELLTFFCRGSGVLWLFLGGVFVANAAFNNLQHPFLSAGFNWGRATLGTIPFVTLGAWYSGPEGGFVGMIFGAILFGVGAVVASYVVVRRLAEHSPQSAT